VPDNSASERALRVVALGRKNWLFAGSNAGGVHAAKLYSLIASAKHHALEPYAYLRALFERLPSHPADRVSNHPNSPLSDHLPVPPVLVPVVVAGPVEPVGGALFAPSKELWEKHFGLFPWLRQDPRATSSRP
jgi:hypothetical protein